MNINSLLIIEALLHETLEAAVKAHDYQKSSVILGIIQEVKAELNSSVAVVMEQEPTETSDENWEEFHKGKTELKRGDKIRLRNGNICTVTGGIDMHPALGKLHCYCEEVPSVSIALIDAYLPNQETVIPGWVLYQGWDLFEDDCIKIEGFTDEFTVIKDEGDYVKTTWVAANDSRNCFSKKDIKFVWKNN